MVLVQRGSWLGGCSFPSMADLLGPSSMPSEHPSDRPGRASRGGKKIKPNINQPPNKGLTVHPSQQAKEACC